MSPTPAPNYKNTLCVDFDGVLHSYTSGWKSVDVIPDPPVPGALRWLKQASEHFNVVIHSSRSNDPLGVAAMQRWLKHHASTSTELHEDEAADLLDVVRFVQAGEGKPTAFLTIDDRCIPFDGDWSKLDPAKLRDFKPWNYQAQQQARTEITGNLAVTQDSVTK
jgi:hypothetical protein